MSIMDDVFDVREALKGKPEQKAFKRIEDALWRMENALSERNSTLEALRRGAIALKGLADRGEAA